MTTLIIKREIRKHPNGSLIPMHFQFKEEKVKFYSSKAANNFYRLKTGAVVLFFGASHIFCYE
jgi:hypothetical protein